MIKYLISRPISVIMAFTALFILGIVTYLNVPVSLLPDIAIPEISVQISGKNTSARELENTVVSPIRQQLLQVANLRDIRTETRDGNAIVRLSFEYGTNTDLAFIEVNEKIDVAMNYLPHEFDRPRVIKASATDIPVLNLYLTLKADSAFQPTETTRFLDLCEFSETVVRRRIEQLPEVAMVDMSGMLRKQVVIVPNNRLLESTGILLSDIENALNNNNIEQGNLVVRDGFYEYNVKFSAVLRTIEDIQNIFIRKVDKLFQLKDLAEVSFVPEIEDGLILYNGKRAICLAIIKQSEENMTKMKKSLSGQIDNFKDSYAGIEFSSSQNQTELLDYTISNLQQNLLIAFIFICLVSVIFMRDIKSPVVIGITMFISLTISLMFFYLCHISLNVVSLTGLILALGMMIDNSIIVTDNIGQYRRKGWSIEEACIKGTNEVIAPMLSSMLTTTSVFVPLVFLSGIAGAIFFDQAFSVTVGLLVSYFTGIILLPVMYKMVYTKWGTKTGMQVVGNNDLPAEKETLDERIYHRGIHWIFRHKLFTTLVMLAVFPLCYLLFVMIPKQKLPSISQNELIVKVEWNENIHLEENTRRMSAFLQSLGKEVKESSSLLGQQQFMLNREREQTASESQVYLRTSHKRDLERVKQQVSDYFPAHHPKAIITFAPAGTIFDKIFDTGSPELSVEYYSQNRAHKPDAQAIRSLEKQVAERTGEKPLGVSFQGQLNIHIDQEKLLLYKVPYDEVYRALKTGFRGNEFSVLRSYQQYLPIVIGGDERVVRDVIDNTLIYTTINEDNIRRQLPISTFVSVTPTEDIKTIVAGKNGEYIPLDFQRTNKPEQIINAIKSDISQQNVWDVDFSGNFFSNKKMIGELLVILFISILLMYFILAAQFESFIQPLIVLLEIPIDVAASMLLLITLGHSLNLMSAIGIVVTCGIIINDSILKVDMINQLRREGLPLMDAIHTSGKRRLKAILMTSLTAIVCMLPILFSGDLGSELEKPLAIATIGGMVIGTPVSLFVVPLLYWWIYQKTEKQKIKN